MIQCLAFSPETIKCPNLLANDVELIIQRHLVLRAVNWCFIEFNQSSDLSVSLLTDYFPIFSVDSNELRGENPNRTLSDDVAYLNENDVGAFEGTNIGSIKTMVYKNQKRLTSFCKIFCRFSFPRRNPKPNITR